MAAGGVLVASVSPGSVVGRGCARLVGAVGVQAASSGGSLVWCRVCWVAAVALRSAALDIIGTTADAPLITDG